MKKFLSLALLVAVTSCVTAFVYLRFRYPVLEKEQLRLYTIHSEHTLSDYSGYFTRDSLGVDGMTLILKKMLKDDPSLALAFCIDSYKNLITREFQDEQRDAGYYNRIIESIIHEDSDGTKLHYLFNQKYYVDTSENDKCVLIRVYPFSLSQKIMLMLAFECVAAVAFALLIVLGFVSAATSGRKGRRIKQKKTMTVEESRNLSVDDLTQSAFANRNTADERETETEIDDGESVLGPFKSGEDVIRIENRRKAAIKIRNFESYIFNLFYKLSIQYQVRSLALYLYDSDDSSLKKIYELFGSAFVKTPPHNSLEIEDNSEIIRALFEDSVIVRNNSRKVYIPIFSDDTFTGMLVLKNDTPISGQVYNSIRTRSQGIGTYLMKEIHKKAV
ncbi:MAG: hypothetical protein ACOC2H_00870 [Spirochaetota bacterium]